MAMARKDPRKRLYALLHIASDDMRSRVPDWDDDDYRLVLKEHGAKLRNGKYSATTMSLVQLEKALEYFKQSGFKVRRTRSEGNWRAARIAKLNALWCELADAGHVRDRSEVAMQSWCANQVHGLTRLQWATSPQLNQAVEMLKRYCHRCNVDVE